jgi:hypothetical protein
VSEPEDPGPPPERGLVVRPQGEGFYARVWPRPVPPARRVVPPLAGTAAAAGVLAFLSGPDPVLRLTVALSIGLFGLLLVLFALGAGFMPVEITVDDDRVAWGGERYPIRTVTDCVVVGRALELRGAEGRVLARIDGVDPAVGRWLSLAIRASLPRS